MSPRWTLAIGCVLLGASASLAQPATYPGNPYQGYGPVVINNLSGPDPYATAGVNPTAWWPINGAVQPGLPRISDRLYVRADYLHWWTEGMDLPPLVTTSPAGTPQNQAAILGEPGTGVLFGNGEINEGSVSGFRGQVGFWLSSQAAFGIEGEYFQLGEQDDRYNVASDGTTILGRPFFDIVNGRETAQLVSFPNLVAGGVSIGSKSNLKSFLVNGRAALCPILGAPCNAQGQQDRVDWIVGYRFLRLDDRLVIGQNLESLVPTAPGTLAISESFDTSNKFNGLQLGVVYQANFRRAWLESLLRVAVGHNTQSVQIRGATTITEPSGTNDYTGGLLAQRTNIGDYDREQFTMIPEVGLTLGFRLTDRLFATAGYSLLYYPNVVRAGDQIDTDVNPNLLAPEANPFSGALRPRFRYIETDYWAQGLNLGAEFRF